MKRATWVLASLTLLLGGGGAARAGMILSYTYASASDYGQTYDNTTGSYLNYYSNSSYQYVGSPSPNSATVTLSDSQSTLPGGSISAGGTALVTLSPSAGSFDLVTAPVTGAASSSVSSSGFTSSYTYNNSSVSGIFTLTSPYSYELTVDLTPLTSAGSASGSSNSFAQGYGSYSLYSYSTGYLAYGYNYLTQYAGSSPQGSGYNLAHGLESSVYNPSVVVTGVMQPGTYAFQSFTQGYASVYGYDASASGSVTQSYALRLAPAAVPEPSSLVLLGTAAASGVGYLGWRHWRTLLALA